jgi:DNA polymerase-3 subunit delta'
LLIGPKERRMQEGLCHDIRLKPFMGGRRIAIIDDADTFNDEGSNCLLKTLEEPPPQSVLILIGTSPDRQLPTIRSRSQIIRFRPLEPEVIARLLVEHDVVDDPQQAGRIAALAGGSMQRAAEMADPAWLDFRRQLLEGLGRPALDSGSVARMVLAFVDAAGKEASARRGRLRLVLEIAVDFYREVARQLSGLPVDGESELAKAAAKVRTALDGDLDAAAACVERTLEALAHVERNANQSTLTEAWLDDLVQQLVLGRPLVMDPLR